MTRLRLEFSHLREHKFRHNFQDTLNPLCSCNLLESESVNHFLLLCPIYASQRKILLDSVFELVLYICIRQCKVFTKLSRHINYKQWLEQEEDIVENLSNNSKLAELLLYGNPLLYPKNVNASILKLTISYLMNTERFDCPLF